MSSVLCRAKEKVSGPSKNKTILILFWGTVQMDFFRPKQNLYCTIITVREMVPGNAASPSPSPSPSPVLSSSSAAAARSLRSGCPYSRYTLETKWLRGSGTRPCTPVNRRSARRKKGTVRVETTRGWFTTQRSFRLCKDRRSSAIRTAQPVKRFAV